MKKRTRKHPHDCKLPTKITEPCVWTCGVCDRTYELQLVPTWKELVDVSRLRAITKRNASRDRVS